jgi:hypothetical protein
MSCWCLERKWRRMRWPRQLTCNEIWKRYKDFVGNFQVKKRPLQRHNSNVEDDVKVNLIRVDCEEWTGLRWSRIVERQTFFTWLWTLEFCNSRKYLWNIWSNSTKILTAYLPDCVVQQKSIDGTCLYLHKISCALYLIRNN